MSAAAPTRLPDPLSAHVLFETREVDVARASVAQKYCPHKLTPGLSHREFDARHHHAAGETLSLTYMRYGCDVTIDPGELTDFYLVQIPLRGAAMVQNGLRQVEASQRTGTVLNATRETRMTWHAGCEKLLLQVDAAALHRTAENLAGLSIPQPIVFDPEIRLTTPAIGRWESKFLAAITVADQQRAFGGNAHKHQALFEEDLIAGFLMAQPSTVRHLLTRDRGQIPSAQLNRARDFIMENLANPITVGQIAGAAGCSIRSLQVAFRENFDCTPIGYLQRQRLGYAHMLLQSLPPDTRVSEIAYEAGFSHMGRFSIAYRDAFGRSPSETLRKGRFS